MTKLCPTKLPSNAQSADRSPDGARVHAGVRHARFIAPDVPLHVVSRVFQGRHLLRPCEELNSIIAGVMGRAQDLYVEVRLFAVAFLSNHVHFMLQGPPDQVPSFIGFIKREISRRWGRNPRVGWRGTMWHECRSAALPTAESQLSCFKYVLSQGTKEGLVARPQDWPGVHCANALMTGQPMSGRWFDGTRYSRRVDAERRRQQPRRVERRDYFSDESVSFAPIPAWEALSDEARRGRTQELVAAIEAESAQARSGRRVLGPRRVKRVSLERRTAVPTQPWLDRGRRMICWGSPKAPEAAAYLARYWEFQTAFRAAAALARLATSPTAPPFPLGAYIPGRINLRTPSARALQ